MRSPISLSPTWLWRPKVKTTVIPPHPSPVPLQLNRPRKDIDILSPHTPPWPTLPTHPLPCCLPTHLAPAPFPENTSVNWNLPLPGASVTSCRWQGADLIRVID